MKKKQNQLVKSLSQGLRQPVFRLPRVFFGWAFAFVFLILFGLAGTQVAKAQATQCNITAPPEACTCTVGIPCDVSLTFNTLDPEEDPLQVKFSAEIVSCLGDACSYTMQSCQITPPDDGKFTITDKPPVCTTSFSEAGPGPFTANAVYLFNDDGTYISNYEVCDDSGHCSSGQQEINVVVAPGAFTWANPDHTHTSTKDDFFITWHWTPAEYASNYYVYVDEILAPSMPLSPSVTSWEQHLGSILPQNYNKPSGRVWIVATRYDQSPISITGGARERYTEAAVPVDPTCVANSSQRITWGWLTGGGQQDYYAANVDVGEPAPNSGWTTQTSWVQIGLTPETSYTTEIKARNNDKEETNTTSVSCTTLPRAVLSATLTGTPGVSGWYNSLNFNYNVSCIAEEDNFLTKCETQRRTALRLNGNMTPDLWDDWISIVNPALPPNSPDWSYLGDFEGNNGRLFQFRVEVGDTTGNTAYSAIVPPPGDNEVAIKFDEDAPWAFAAVVGSTIINGVKTISEVMDFVVAATWYDWPEFDPEAGLGHSGVERWFLQYKINDEDAWYDCNETGFSYNKTSIAFGRECSPPPTLVHRTTYCFQAAAKDAAGNMGDYYFNPDSNADMCIYYMSSLEPIVPHTPTPADGAVVPASLSQLSWMGCDPDSHSDYYSYDVFLSQPNQPLTMADPCSGSGDCRGSLSAPQQSCNSLCSPPTNGCRAYYNLTGFSPSPKQIYLWGVSAKDTYNTVYSQPAEGWRFTINTPPQIQNVNITRSAGWPSNGGDDVINGQATITWEYRDLDNDPNPATQPITFNITYGSAGTGKNIVLGIASNDPKLNCSGGNGSNVFRQCTYLWNSLCAPAAVNQLVQVEAVDGVEKTPDLSGVFTINHIMPACYPGPEANDNIFRRANNGDTEEFIIKSLNTTNPTEQYSLIYNPDSAAPKINFRGVCTSPSSTSHTADANALGNAAVFNQTLNSGATSGKITLRDLIADNSQPNRVKFTVDSCGQVDYNICYNLASLCDEPYVSVEEGSIYSQGDIRAEYTPPAGSFNATYFVLGGGTQMQTKVIENFISSSPTPGLSFVDPSFGQMVYPSTSAAPGAQVSSFDYYGLTHNMAGTEVEDGKPNIYGHPVWVWKDGTPLHEIVREGEPLQGRILRIKGDLIVQSPAEFANGREKSGAGLIIVDGDLFIRANLSYEPTLPKINARELASIGWLVLGNVEIDPSVSQVVGSFFVAGIEIKATGGLGGVKTPELAGGVFKTGESNVALRIFGAVIARKFALERTASAGGEPSEKVIADGRVSLNTPPGFKDIMSTLPSWQFRTPLPPAP